MTRANRAGFTLVELLVVITIAGVLLALLTPAAQVAYDVALAAKCRHNLRMLYNAQGMYRADSKTQFFATGPGWLWNLRPYLENQGEILICPKGPGADAFAGEDAGGGGGGGGGGGAGEGTGGGAGGFRRAPLKMSDIAWEVYHGAYLYDIDLSQTQYMRIMPGARGPDWTRYEIEDEGPRLPAGVVDDWPIVVEVRMDGAEPVEIAFLDGGIECLFTHNFKVAEEILIWNYDANNAGGVYKLPLNPLDLTDLTAVRGRAMSDYGLSRGSYEVVGGPVPLVDGKLFFILDYAKALADYSDIGLNDDPNSFFVTDEAHWTPPEGYEDGDWRKVTSLRHSGRANVLFCDSHVESLSFGPQTDEDLKADRFLHADSSRWRFSWR